MDKEHIFETSDFNPTLSQQIAVGDFSAFIRCESLKSNKGNLTLMFKLGS